MLPDALQSALARLTEGLSRRELAERARAISETYRSGGTSRPIADGRDALAYALARMPATYAAVSACVEALREARLNFQPTSIIDAGAGPGTASWAAAEAFPSLSEFALLDASSPLTDLARTLVTGSEWVAGAGFRTGDIARLLANAPGADLVIASYLIGELDEQERIGLGPLLWERANDALLIVEPGTPAGYARIIAMRAQLIDLGAHVLAPCPHDNACPLVPPDWCHFAQRLSRTRDHMLLKDADVPFEDEKFAYVVLSRTPAEARRPRVLAPPRTSKAAIEAKLCTADGVVEAGVARRDKTAYARARRWRWGDTPN
jgi:ribosomal protein RSM22 (predicted rRNA methylase)